MVSKHNEKANKEKIASSIAFIISMLMYITFILFNNSILKSVVEEKANKLAEVLSIFVKPVNLMVGKIIGQCAAFLLQLSLWIVTFYLYIKCLSWVESYYLSHDNIESGNYLKHSLKEISKLPLKNIILYFPLFLIMGFLFNGAFTTIIAIYSSRKNTNAFMFLGNIINILSIYFGIYAATNPGSDIVKFSYYLPFINYITVPTTLAFDLPTHTIISSLLILMGSVIILFYLSGKTYLKSISS